MNTEPWAAAEQVAQHLGLAKDTVYCCRECKKLPTNKIGQLWKFQLSEVDEWVRAYVVDEDLEIRIRSYTAAPEGGTA